MSCSIICDNCGYDTAYDKENTLYLKCRCCSVVLVDSEIDEEKFVLEECMACY